jgi:uncharacterized membrane protein/mono/diheme cytochrome c family protein
MSKWWLSVAVSVAVFAGLKPAVVEAQAPVSTRDLGSEVRALFANKCAGCHGADLAKPKGRFGYVLDLRRVAENPDMVIPRSPSESELWVLVERGEMPPEDAPQGPLTPAQKEIVREWIAAGAPDASPIASDSVPPANDPADPPITVKELSFADRTLRWLGKFHLLLLHFPIALAVAAGIAEVWSVYRRRALPSESVRFCLWIGACAAIPAAVFGWLHAAAGNGAGSPQILLAHRWLGTTAAVWIVLTAVFAERDARRQVRTWRVRFLLATGILLTTLAAHFGGLLAQGSDFFTY